ncbi:MFS transporter [Franconibacter sp. IITDAS19]|uniref:MFS transporter n=1 Tax=Franconibacter sp. IITDAS19 TaxID=2930569 RepID=UPI001FFBF113|nr:MFS transporter [Franconibacter sp. IITDAS19]MCK1968546.1 MFS transporter [Franconibacter sp. IITDAS19]
MSSRFATLRRIPRGVWIIGFVSLLMDISSEMIHSLLPLFMATALGTPVVVIGLIEGLAEATALCVKVFSGVISDYIGKRKGLAVLGYGLGAVSKPLFALASTSGMVFSARIIDRLGKGIRGAPRDALVADVTPPDIRGAAYGLRQTLDTTGSFLGPLLAVGLMLLWHNDFRSVYWVAVIPAFLAVGLLCFGLHEPRKPVEHRRSNPIKKENLKRLGRDCWQVIGLGAVFTLARFSEAFLVLRAQEVGIPLALIPLVMVAMYVVFSVTAYPFGRLSDTLSHRRLLQLGLLVLIAADITLAMSQGWQGIIAGVALWGVHMGMTQGLFNAMVARTAPADLRGTAFGIFSLLSGAGLLLASLGAGLLWDIWGSGSTFYAGALLCLLTLLVTRFAPEKRPPYGGRKT